MQFLYLFSVWIFASDLAAASSSLRGVPPLITAAQSGHHAFVVQLINGDTALDVTNEKGYTAVHYAVLLNDMRLLQLLLDGGADANIADNYGNTPLALWSSHKNKKMLALLQDAVAKSLQTEKVIPPENTNEAEEKSKEEIVEHVAKDLFEAVENNDRSGIERLLAEGVDAKEKKTPFQFAIEAEHYALAAILLKAMAGINGKDEKGWTPLNWAIAANDWELVREFIREGADFFAGRRQNALDVAAMMHSETKLIEIIATERGDDAVFNRSVFVWSILKGKLDVVKLFLGKGIDVNYQDEYNNTMLMAAVAKEQTEIAKLLIESGADLNIQNYDGETALIQAAERGNTEIVKLLIESGADLNIQNNRHNKRGDTALTLAVHNKRTDTVKLLIEKGADLNIQNRDGKTALIKAADRGDREIVKLLIEKDAVGNWSPLNWAIVDNDWELVRKLIREGADFSVGHYQNALDVAVMMQSEAKLIEIIATERSADAVFGTDKDLETLLTWAIKTGSMEAIKFLIEQDANLNMQDALGHTALILAAEKGHTDTVKLLIENGADLNMQNMSNDTALHTTTNIEIVKLLIENGADLNIQNRYGDTALLSALRGKSTEIVKLLIEKVNNLDIQNYDNFNALMRAVNRENMEIVKLLIEKGADLNKTTKGYTALIWAVVRGNVELVKLLIEEGADLNKKTVYGDTALRMAQKDHHSEIAKILRDAGAQ